MAKNLSKPLDDTPGDTHDINKMLGHWVLARLGKRVLRPGGRELTEKMLSFLDIGNTDDVVEFAPGLGVTAKLTLQRLPVSFTGIERDEAAARRVREYLSGPDKCIVASADKTGLADNSASVVYGEAMLTMQTPTGKAQIVSEAHRILKPGGKYGIHELCLLPDDLPENLKQEIQQALSNAIHVGARPLTPLEWRNILESQGFRVELEARAPMALLETKRVLQDEGFSGTLRFTCNVLRDKAARQRILTMRSVFRKYRRQMAAVALVAIKQ